MSCLYENGPYAVFPDYVIPVFDGLGRHIPVVCRHLLIIYNPDETFSIPTNGNLLDEYLRCFYG